MSDGYECDRCGNALGGAPHKTVGFGDGIAYQRSAPAFEKEMFRDHPPGAPYDHAVDICPSCWNDLKRFWANPGGDVSKIGVEDCDE